MSEIKSRKEHGKEKGEIDKELGKEEKDQDQHTKDAEIAERALSSIDSAGTREGHDARVKASDAADRAVKKEADKLEKAEQKISKEGESAEKALDKTAGGAAKDQKKIQDAAGKVKFDDLQKELAQTAEKSREDQQWLEKTKQEREQRRSQADSHTEKFGEHIKSKNMKIKG
ncbi:hypothetical protein [Roseovarius sp.]|uniref:hypothetical protein n=1 Tax=Roseovarius sp. TaxID=1486281 RepID=UPI0035677039